MTTIKRAYDGGCSGPDNHIPNCTHFGYTGAYLSNHSKECEKQTGGGSTAPCFCNPYARALATYQDYLTPQGLLKFQALCKEHGRFDTIYFEELARLIVPRMTDALLSVIGMVAAPAPQRIATSKVRHAVSRITS